LFLLKVTNGPIKKQNFPVDESQGVEILPWNMLDSVFVHIDLTDNIFSRIMTINNIKLPMRRLS
jgi:hypothetical protein